MNSKAFHRPLVGLGLLLLLAACEAHTQTTSGQGYLQRYADQSAAAGGAGEMDADVRESADVEPILTFPARIGVARVDRGLLTPPPRIEAEAWLAVAGRLGPKWGQFVPISPLITALAAKPLGKEERHCGGYYSHCLERTIRDIRLGAARQHVDVVLIYESFGKSDTTSNPLAVTWVSLVGMMVAPSEQISADGFAQAVLLDVRNGYSYGFASAEAKDAAFTLSTLINARGNREEVVDEAKVAAVLELAKEVEQMARDLRVELAETRLKRIDAKAE